MLFFDANFLAEVLNNSKLKPTKMSIREFASIIGFLCFENKNYSTLVIQTAI